MNNVENVDVASAGVFVGEAYEAGDMVGWGRGVKTWRNFSKVIFAENDLFCRDS